MTSNSEGQSSFPFQQRSFKNCVTYLNQGCVPENENRTQQRESEIQ